MSVLKVALGIAGLAALGVGGYLIYRHFQESEETPPAPPEIPEAPARPRTPQPVKYATPKAKVASRVQAAVPGVQLAEKRVITDRSTGQRETVIVGKRPVTAREGEAVMRHIVTPAVKPGGDTASRSPSRSGKGRSI